MAERWIRTQDLRVGNPILKLLGSQLFTYHTKWFEEGSLEKLENKNILTDSLNECWTIINIFNFNWNYLQTFKINQSLFEHIKIKGMNKINHNKQKQSTGWGVLKNSCSYFANWQTFQISEVQKHYLLALLARFWENLDILKTHNFSQAETLFLFNIQVSYNENKHLIAKRSVVSVAHLPKIKYCSSFYRSESACKRGFSHTCIKRFFAFFAYNLFLSAVLSADCVVLIHGFYTGMRS